MNALQPRLKWLANITTIGMLLVLLGGALVTKTESGDGCGASWPLCKGKWIPDEITPQLVIEFSHRAVSGIVGILVLLLAYWSWKQIGHIRETKFLAVVSVLFLVLQSLIGAARVIWGQSDYILAAHFGISLISFSAVLLLAILIHEIDKKFAADRLILDGFMKKNTVAVSVYAFFVVYTGALVRHTGASMICSGWPLCRGRLEFPDNLFEWVQMGHRFAAGLLYLWIFVIMLYGIRRYKDKPVIYYGWIIAFLLASLQVLSGALIIFTKLNLFIALMHALFISCLFGLITYFLLLVYRSRLNEMKNAGPPVNLSR